MKKNFFLLISVTIIACSCTFNRIEKTDYTEFYDLDRTKIAVKGKLINGDETGEWKFFSEDGKVIKSGAYYFGLPQGIWQYDINGTITSVAWRIVDTLNFSFSLPSGFIYFSNMSDSSRLSYLDTTTRTMFFFSRHFNCDTTCLSNYYGRSLAETRTVFDVLNSKSLKVFSKHGLYYFDRYSLKEKNLGHEIEQYYMYKNVGNNTAIVVSIIGRMNNRKYLRVILEDIFYHARYDSQKLSPSLEENRVDKIDY